MTANITSLSARLNNFVSVFPTEGEAEVFDVPSGPYMLLVNVEMDGQSPVVVFSFYNENLEDITAEKHLDYADFIHGLDAKYLDYTLRKSFGKSFNQTTDALAIKNKWKIDALKDLFADRIEGNDEFWTRFNRDLERVLQPIATEILCKAILRDQLSLMSGPR